MAQIFMNLKEGWQSVLVVTGLLLLTAVLRLVVVDHYWAELLDDRDAYLGIASRVIQGDGFCMPEGQEPTAFRPPLYPLLLVPFYGWGGETGIALLQILASLLCVAGTVALGAVFGLGKWKYLAGLLIAVDPILLRYTPQPMTEIVSTSLVVWTLWAWCSFLKRGKWTEGIVAGILFGLSCLCRPTYLPFPVVLITLQTVAFYLRQARPEAESTRVDSCRQGEAGSNLWQSYRKTIFVSLVGLLVMLPWGLRNWAVLGEFKLTTTHGGYTLLLGNNESFYESLRVSGWDPKTGWGGNWSHWDDPSNAGPDSHHEWYLRLQDQLEQEGAKTELQRDRRQNEMARAAIFNDPGSFLTACLLRQIRFWYPIPIGPEAVQIPGWLMWGLGVHAGAVYFLAIVGICLVIWNFRRSDPVAELEYGQVTPQKRETGKSTEPQSQTGQAQTRQVWSGSYCRNCSVLLLAMVLTICTAHLFYWANARMRAPLIPIVSVLAALGVAGLYQRNLNHRHRNQHHLQTSPAESTRRNIN